MIKTTIIKRYILRCNYLVCFSPPQSTQQHPKFQDNPNVQTSLNSIWGGLFLEERTIRESDNQENDYLHFESVRSHYRCAMVSDGKFKESDKKKEVFLKFTSKAMQHLSSMRRITVISIISFYMLTLV